MLHWFGNLLRLVFWFANFVTRLVLVAILLVLAAFAGFVSVKSAQPIGSIREDSIYLPTETTHLNYWQFMANRLHASSQTPAICHRTRLVYLVIALPVYPTLYTYAGLLPVSVLSQHIQPSPTIPGKINWRKVPDTWWRLVVEVSWLAFLEPQWDFTPAVGETMRLDERCSISE